MPGFSSTETVTCWRAWVPLLLIESHFLVDDQDFVHPGFKVWIAAFQIVALLMGLYWMRFENALNGGFSGLAQGGMPGLRARVDEHVGLRPIRTRLRRRSHARSVCCRPDARPRL